MPQLFFAHAAPIFPRHIVSADAAQFNLFSIDINAVFLCPVRAAIPDLAESDPVLIFLHFLSVYR